MWIFPPTVFTKPSKTFTSWSPITRVNWRFVDTGNLILKWICTVSPMVNSRFPAPPKIEEFVTCSPRYSTGWIETVSGWVMLKGLQCARWYNSDRWLCTKLPAATERFTWAVRLPNTPTPLSSLQSKHYRNCLQLCYVIKLKSSVQKWPKWRFSVTF